MIDTQPIEVYQPQHANNSKTAQPFVSKGYCAAKKEILDRCEASDYCSRKKVQIHLTMKFALALAAIHDLEIAKETLPQFELQSVKFYGDSAFIDQNFQLELFESKAIQLQTPIKTKKGQKQLQLF